MSGHELSDSDENYTQTQNPEPPNKEAIFKKIEKNRIIDSLLSLDDLGPQNEVWLLKAPSDVNLDHFLQNNLSFSSKVNGSIKIQNKPYETIARKKSSTISFLIPNARGKVKPVGVHCRGEIRLQEYLDVPNLPVISVSPRAPVRPLGEIRRRHPFFVGGDVPSAEENITSKKRKRLDSDDVEVPKKKSKMRL